MRASIGVVTTFSSLVALAQIAPLVHAQERNLSIRPHVQHTMMWCWAASIAMVVEHETGRTIEDCEVLNAYDRALGGAGACCANPSACFRGAMPGEVETVLGNVFDVHGRSFPSPAPFETMRQHIDSGHPVVLWLWRTPTSAHVVVVAGYNAQSASLLVLDPMQGALWVPYATLRANWQTGVWRDTIFVTHGGDRSPPPPRDPAPPDPAPVAAHWCCTPAGRFGPYYPNDVPVGATCQWNLGSGVVWGTACN